VLVRAPVFTLILLLVLPPAAAAEPALFGTAEVSASGGHDTNMFLQVSPDAAMREPRISGYYGRVSPRLGAGLSAAGWRLDLVYDLDYRGSDAAGHLLLQQIDLSIAAPRLGRLRPTLLGSAGRFDASRFPADQFNFAGGGLELRYEITDTVRVTGAYRAELRAFPQRAGERDLVHLAELRFAYRPAPTFEVGVGSAYLAVAPAHAAVMDDGTVQVIRVGPDTELVWGRLSLGLSVWGGTIEFASVGRDWQVGGGVGALVRLSRNLDLSATVDLTAAPWADELRSQDYSRRYFGLGLVAHATGRHALTGAPAPAALRPVVEKGRVRFRMRSPQAEAVTVVGSWDDWAAPGQTLAHTGEAGLWEGWVEVPPGVHRYRFLVDGRAVRPPDAHRYVKDDFGEEDAVLEVPQEAP
jgi:hypothetical protein